MHKQQFGSRAWYLAAFTVLSGGQAVGVPNTAAQAAETEAGAYRDAEIVVTARRREESAQDVPIALRSSVAPGWKRPASQRSIR